MSGTGSMMASLLMGLVAGARSMTPLAAVAWLARTDGRRKGGSLERRLRAPLVAEGASLLALGELFGDKMRWAPDRTIAPGLAARVVTGAVAGAALAPPRDRRIGALVGAAAAVGSSYVTLSARSHFMARFGQRPTGLAEDALVVAAAVWIVHGARRSGNGR